MGHFAKLISIIAGSNYNEGHVDFVCVLQTLLFNFDRATYYYIVAIRYITLIEDPCLLLTYRYIFCNLEQFLLHCFRVLREEAQFLA